MRKEPLFIENTGYRMR